MKNIKLSILPLFVSALLATSCDAISINNKNNDNDNNNNNNKEVDQTIFEENKRDALYQYGKNTGYEISFSVTDTSQSEDAKHYISGYKGNLIWKMEYDTLYTAYELVDNGSCTMYSYNYELERWSVMGEGNNSNVFENAGFNSSVNRLYSTNQYVKYEGFVEEGTGTYLDRTIHKYNYFQDFGSTTVNYEFYVEEQFGLTCYSKITYNRQDGAYYQEMSVTAIKVGDEVTLPAVH